MGVGSVLESWGYGLEGQERVFEKGEFGGIEFREGNLLRASSPIDLGAFGKGYAADKAAEILKSVSQNFLIDAGGDILAFGGDLGAGHKSFKIAFENPLDPKEAIGFVQSDRMALASSSAQKRKWGDKHHLVDGKNLQCAEDMLAVFVQGEDLMSADAYSTLLFVMGFERAREYLQKRPQKFEALILQSDFSFYRTESFEGELFLG